MEFARKPNHSFHVRKTARMSCQVASDSMTRAVNRARRSPPMKASKSDAGKHLNQAKRDICQASKTTTLSSDTPTFDTRRRRETRPIFASLLLTRTTSCSLTISMDKVNRTIASDILAVKRRLLAWESLEAMEPNSISLLLISFGMRKRCLRVPATIETDKKAR